MLNCMLIVLSFLPAVDDAKKSKAPAFSESDLNETIRWMASLEKKLEVAKVNSVKAQNDLEYDETRAEVSKVISNLKDRQVRWQAKVILVKSSGTKVEKIYTHDKFPVEVDFGGSVGVKSKGLEGVKPGEWIWVVGTISRAELPSQNARTHPKYFTIHVSPFSSEKVKKDAK
jgi:hypothetical protein